MVLCEEWWEVTKDAACLFDIYKIYRDPNTRKTIRKAIIYECIIIVILAYLLQRDEDVDPNVSKGLSNILKIAHQNFL
jgi:hypothetical protein